MTTATKAKPKQKTGSTSDPASSLAIQSYVRTYAKCYGLKRTAQALGVSRQTLWRFLEAGPHGAVHTTCCSKKGGRY